MTIFTLVDSKPVCIHASINRINALTSELFCVIHRAVCVVRRRALRAGYSGGNPDKRMLGGAISHMVGRVHVDSP
jgi:hypothetical protein